MLKCLYISWQPAKVRAVIDLITGVPFEEIEVPLQGFSWDFERVRLAALNSTLADKSIALLQKQGEAASWNVSAN